MDIGIDKKEHRSRARPRCRVDFKHDQTLLPASSIDASRTERSAGDRKIEETPVQQHVLIDVKIERHCHVGDFYFSTREAVIGRRQENQWLGELQRGTGPRQWGNCPADE